MARSGVLVSASILAIVASAAHADGAALSLIDAVKLGDQASVSAALRHHANLNAREVDGSTALLWAVYHDDVDTATQLLRAGANPSLSNRYGISPLLEACRTGDGTLVKELIARGAKLDTAYPDGETLIMAASNSGSLETIKLLISKGLPVNATERVENQTALMWAAGAGHADVVKLLLEAGADPNLRAHEITLPWPTQDQGRSWTDHPPGGMTALMFAAREGHLDAARALLEQGRADPNIKTPGNITAMLIAVLNDRLDLADLLLEHGADANDGSLSEMVNLRALRMDAVAGDATRPRPMHDNAMNSLQFVQSLLDHGADPNHVAEYNVRVVGELGAIYRVTFRSAYENTLQHFDADMLHLLLARKLVNPNQTGAGKDLPLVVVAGVTFFGGFGPATPPAPYRIPGIRGAVPVMQLLVDSGADVNQIAGPSKEAAIHKAAESGDADIIRFLARHGAQLDAKDGAGLTPVELASGKRPSKDPKAAQLGFSRPPQPHPETVALLQQLMDAPAATQKADSQPAIGQPVARVGQ